MRQIDGEQSRSLNEPRLDRWFWLAMLISALVVIPRCMLLSRADSETVDEPAHVDRGLTIAYGNRAHKSIEMNDPPFGDVVIVLPMILMGADPADQIVWKNWPGGKPAQLPKLRPEMARRLRIMRQEVFYGFAASPEALLMGIAIWKAILFVPFAALVFHIGRWLYGMHAGWLALAMLLIDPTFAAHTGLATLDVMGVEAIVLACYVGWKYFQNPSRATLIAMACCVALAFAIKYTATGLPVVLIGYGMVFWWKYGVRRMASGNANAVLTPSPGTPGEGGGLSAFSVQNSAFNSGPHRCPPRFDSAHRGPEYQGMGAWRQVINDAALFLLVFVAVIWASTLFDFSTPREWMWPVSYDKGSGFHLVRDYLDPLLDLRWPGGIYIGSFLGGMVHAHRGHWGFLWGENRRPGGWWYYFFVVATYKIPVGFFVVMVLGAVSLIWVRPRFLEWMVVIPAVVFCVMVSASKIDIGFRHFLPVMAFVYILAARCVAAPLNKSVVMRLLAWLGVAGGLGHTLSYWPDFIPYVNYPRVDAWRDIGDSNIDWGQSLKEVRSWLDAHPTDRPVYIDYFLDEMPVPYYLDHRVKITHGSRGIPKSGLLIISPNCVDSIFDWFDSYAALRKEKPIAVIGHNMLVYDLDRMGRNNSYSGTQVPPPVRNF